MSLPPWPEKASLSALATEGVVTVIADQSLGGEYLRLDRSAARIPGRPADALAEVLPCHREAAIRQRRDLVLVLIARGGSVDQDLTAYRRAVRGEDLRLTA